MLVTITDKSSDKSPQDIRAAVKSLETNGIRVIAVTVGKEVDSNKEKEVPTDGGVIETDNKKDPGSVGQKIVDKIAKGNVVLVFILGVTVKGRVSKPKFLKSGARDSLKLD